MNDRATERAMGGARIVENRQRSVRRNCSISTVVVAAPIMDIALANVRVS
jgi:hypothetical protein